MTETFIPKAQLDTKVAEVINLLNDYDIPITHWGIGKAKTIEHLATEILEGETTLVDRNGEIIRQVELVHVDIRYTLADGVQLQLVEDRQHFHDGRERQRGLTGISEKMKPG